jgi:hypothetical protein
LHLNHFVKLIFENNWHAIAKLISVAFFILSFIVFYLAQTIVSIKNLSSSINLADQRKRVEEKYNLRHHDLHKMNYEYVVSSYYGYVHLCKKEILSNI